MGGEEGAWPSPEGVEEGAEHSPLAVGGVGEAEMTSSNSFSTCSNLQLGCEETKNDEEKYLSQYWKEC